LIYAKYARTCGQLEIARLGMLWEQASSKRTI
jgi:hypothetical protein